jgi:molybdopterin adenylyltransferase
VSPSVPRLPGFLPRARRTAPHGRAAGDSRPIRCAVVTVSDSRRGDADTSGALIERLLVRAGHDVVTRAWTPDEAAPLRRVVVAALERADVDVVIVTGGTGIAPRDRTPETLAPLIETPLPGFGECFRALSFEQIGSAAWLSRAQAGIAGGRLMVLLPGSRSAVDLALRRLLLPELHHAVALLGRFLPKE